MQIQPHYQTMGQLLASRLFRIPEYQRAYSWGSKQRSDLFDDIRKVASAGPDATHFMATTVALRRKRVPVGAEEFVELEVVDGQQRLTTIVILLRAICNSLKASQNRAEQRLGDDLQALLVKRDDFTLLLLQTNHDSSHTELVLQCGASPRKAVEYSRWLLRVTKAEDNLLARHRLRAVTQIVQARLVAIAVLLREFPRVTEDKVLKRWESVTFRLYGLKHLDARSAVGDHVRLSWEIHNEDLKPAAILERIQKIGELAPTKDAVNTLWKDDCYNGWTESLRYFLFRYEEHLASLRGQQINESQWNRIHGFTTTNSTNRGRFFAACHKAALRSSVE